MSGVTDWFRNKCLATVTGTDFVALTGTTVNMLTALPTSEDTAGTTDETEWSLSGVAIVTAPTLPHWLSRENVTDGVELYNNGEILWNSATTSALVGVTTCLGAGVFDDTTGFLVGYDDFAVPLVVNPGEAISFPTDTLRILMRSDL